MEYIILAAVLVVVAVDIYLMSRLPKVDEEAISQDEEER